MNEATSGFSQTNIMINNKSVNQVNGLIRIINNFIRHQFWAGHYKFPAQLVPPKAGAASPETLCVIFILLRK